MRSWINCKKNTRKIRGKIRRNSIRELYCWDTLRASSSYRCSSLGEICTQHCWKIWTHMWSSRHASWLLSSSQPQPLESSPSSAHFSQQQQDVARINTHSPSRGQIVVDVLYTKSHAIPHRVLGSSSHIDILSRVGEHYANRWRVFSSRSVFAIAIFELETCWKSDETSGGRVSRSGSTGCRDGTSRRLWRTRTEIQRDHERDRHKEKGKRREESGDGNSGSAWNKIDSKVEART